MMRSKSEGKSSTTTTQTDKMACFSTPRPLRIACSFVPAIVGSTKERLSV